MIGFRLTTTNIMTAVVAISIVATSGCSTALFKPVQPWHTADTFTRSNNVATQMQVQDGRIAPRTQSVQPVETNSMVDVVSQRDRQQLPSFETSSGNSLAGERQLPDMPIESPESTRETKMQGSHHYHAKNNSTLSQTVANQHPQMHPNPSRGISHGTSLARNSGVTEPIRWQDPQVSQQNKSEIPINRIGNTDQPSVAPSTNLNVREPMAMPPAKTESELKSPLYFGNRPESTEGSRKTTTLYRGQSPQDDEAVFIPTTFANEGQIQQTAAQNPELQNGRVPLSPFQNPGINIGGPNELNPFNPNYAPSGAGTFPLNYADLDIYVSETSTGRINFGGAYNSDSGLVGQFVIDERNFDILRLPRSFRDVVDGTAWRGAGQNFRLELVPGSDVERYLVSFSEPFLFGTRVSFSGSLYYFQRQFFDWDEERLGGRFAFGYRLTPDISVSTGIRMENVEISDPRNATSPTLNATLGDTDLYIGNVSLIRDTRDHPFLPTEGNYTSLTFSQGFGEFDYSRGDIDFRTYRLMYQRPDGSGRHTLSYGTKLGFSGSQTPIFENYYAGGFSTMRGFDFRGASPLEGDIRVGGEFQWLNTVEYTFPITADDMVKGVLFTDFGTVEDSIEIDSDNFRVAPGFGFRVHLPAAGIGAPLAFDFAFPVAEADGDDEEVFSFYLGVSR